MRGQRVIAPLAALAGLMAVACGAFGAHALADPSAKAWLETGARYQFLHAMACFASISMAHWGAPRARFAPPFFLAGMIFFCGALYGLALGGPRWLGAVAPIGGVSFMIGWALLAWAALSLPKSSRDGQ
jgi:uncharacterized membrane protein YgdD (TMEM256/DUF423 family)